MAVWKHVNPAHLAPPTGFSHAVVTRGGSTVHLAGQTALDGTGKIVGTTIVEQTERVFRNLCAVLAEAGAGPEHLVRLTAYVTDIDDYKANARDIGRVWRALMGREYPAMALVGVTRLWDIEALVEYEGVAVIPDPVGVA